MRVRLAPSPTAGMRVEGVRAAASLGGCGQVGEGLRHGGHPDPTPGPAVGRGAQQHPLPKPSCDAGAKPQPCPSPGNLGSLRLPAPGSLPKAGAIGDYLRRADYYSSSMDPKQLCKYRKLFILKINRYLL